LGKSRTTQDNLKAWEKGTKEITQALFVHGGERAPSLMEGIWTLRGDCAFLREGKNKINGVTRRASGKNILQHYFKKLHDAACKKTLV